MTQPIHIESKSNAQYKAVRAIITDAKDRRACGMFAAEGLKIVQDTRAVAAPRQLWLSTSCFQLLAARDGIGSVADDSTRVFVISDDMFGSLSSVQHGEGVMGIFAIGDVAPRMSLTDVVSRPSCVCVLCDHVQDPVNVGAIIRTVFCLGADAVMFTQGTTDVYSPKVIRASAGYCLKLPVFSVSREDVRSLCERYGATLWISECSSLDGAISVEQVNVAQRNMVVFRNEGVGVSAEMKAMSAKRFFIPMHERGESLNINAAVSIAVYHFLSCINK
jgi:TrmH family RNA methyltransferase